MNSLAQIEEAVRSHDAIRVRAGGTKSAACPSGASFTLDLDRWTGITEYSPDECVFSARAGTTVRDIDAELAAHGQYLPFDPPLVGAGATIGGTVAAGVSGSGRYRYGGVRDFLIGVRLVDGEGRTIRSGGKVVKNAAGFLLHHAVVGGAGRLGVLTEVTFKVFPRPEATATVAVPCGSLAAAVASVRRLQAARFDLAAVDFDDAGALWIRLAGRRVSLAARVDKVRTVVGGTCVPEDDEAAVWNSAREFQWAPARDAIVKVPTTLPAVATVFDTGARGAAAGLVGDDVFGGAMKRWTCAGSLAWLAAPDVAVVSAALARAGLGGVVVRGPQAGARLGLDAPNELERRLRGVLDPRNRFRAASDSDR